MRNTSTNTNTANETIRQYCKRVGFEIVGKLKYVGVDEYGKLWIDEAGNEFSKVFRIEYGIKKGYFPGYSIVTADGVVW